MRPGQQVTASASLILEDAQQLFTRWDTATMKPKKTFKGHKKA